MHEEHQMMNGEEDSCVLCHHMNLPGDRNTGCDQCHRDMYLPSDAFKHDWHGSPEGGALPCYECHPKGEVRNAETGKNCAECHEDLVPEGAAIAVEQYDAIGYVQAMHQLCIGCHAQMSADSARCATCHYQTREFVAPESVPSRTRGRVGKRLVLPPY